MCSQSRTSTSFFFTCGIDLNQPPGQRMKFSISVCNKALLRGKIISEWLGLAPKWLDLCPSSSTHGCAPAQSYEIHRLGPNLFISIDWFPYMNCNSVKLLKLLHVMFTFLFSINCQRSLGPPSAAVFPNPGHRWPNSTHFHCSPDKHTWFN